MTARCLSVTGLTLLLLFVSLCQLQVDAGFVFTSTPTEKVPVDKQLNASQAFVKTWQIRANASANVIDNIEANLPCQTFITYASGSSNALSTTNDALGEVRVSGSTACIVNAVRVTSFTLASGAKLMLQTYDRSAKEEFLLVEVVFFVKNKLKLLKNRRDDDVVVLQDVLYFKSTAQKTASRRLGSASDLILGQQLDEDKSNYASSSEFRSWFVRWPSERPSDTHNLNLKISLPGSASFSQTDPDDVASYTAGQIFVAEPKSSSPSFIDQVEVVSSANTTSSTQEIQVRFKANTTGTELAYLNVNGWFVPPLKVNFVVNTTASITNGLDIPYDGRIKIIAGSSGGIFISDKNLKLNSTYATFATYSIGDIQVEIKDMVVSESVSFSSEYSGSITYIGAHKSSLPARLNGDGFLCFPSSAATVSVCPANKSAQVAMLGQQDASFSCVTKPVPESRMTRLEPDKKPTDLSSPAGRDPVEDDMKGLGTVIALICIGVAVGIIVVVAGIGYVVKKRCFSRS